VGRRLHGLPAEAAAQHGGQVVEHGLAADDEDPGVHDGVQRVEAERRQVLRVAAERTNGVDEACDLRGRRRVRSEVTRGENTRELCLNTSL